MSDWRDVMEARRLSDAEAWATAQTKEDAVLVALNALRLEVRTLATLLDHAIRDAGALATLLDHAIRDAAPQQ